jgi:hypothetical protein
MKNGLGYVLGDFITNSSGHPDPNRFIPKRLINVKLKLVDFEGFVAEKYEPLKYNFNYLIVHIAVAKWHSGHRALHKNIRS